MSDKSVIEWTDATWNPITGCTQVSPGCDHCYALTFAERFRGVPGHPYEQGFDLKLWPERLELPLRWRKPRRIFVNSMSDLFHKDVPDEYIRRVFDVMAKADWHIFQVLTKRSARLARLGPTLPWQPHIWAGVSIESDRYIWRANQLRKVPAHVRFISAEPLLGPRLKIMQFIRPCCCSLQIILDPVSFCFSPSTPRNPLFSPDTFCQLYTWVTGYF